MGLEHGYNFVRSGALRTFGEDYRRAYGEANPETVSVVEFLRMVHHKRAPASRCLQVEGFHSLWKVCEDDRALVTSIKHLLSSRASWVRNHFAYVYFVLPSEVQFVEGRTLQLRLPDGEQVDLDVLFSQPIQRDRDHWVKAFSLS